MTRYTVIWTQDALDELINLWMGSGDRSRVTLAVNEIDRQLARDAPMQGIETSESLRAFFAPPLKVLFEVREADRIVEVVLVRPA